MRLKQVLIMAAVAVAAVVGFDAYKARKAGS